MAKKGLRLFYEILVLSIFFLLYADVRALLLPTTCVNLKEGESFAIFIFLAWRLIGEKG